MSVNNSGNDGDVIWVHRPWIIPSLVEETVMVVIVFLASYFVEVYFDTTYFPILGIPFFTLTGLALLSIWLINAVHLLLVRSTSRYTLRRDGLEVKTGILRKNTVLVSTSNFSDVDVMQSYLGKIMGSGEMFVRIRGDHAGEAKIRRVRDPFVLEKDIRRIMAI
jgi:uncharacterized membrane protein YdbT with pleckstrin-like domain